MMLCVKCYIFLNAAKKTETLHIFIDPCPVEHLGDACTSLKAESSLHVSKQSCCAGRKDAPVRLLVSIRLRCKALIQTLWFSGWGDVSCAPVKGSLPPLLEKGEVFCNSRWAASAGAACVWCRHSDWGKSTHLYPPDLPGTFLWNHLGFTVPFDIENEHLAGNRRDGDCCDLKVRWDVNPRLSSMQVAWTKRWRRFTDVFLFCRKGILFFFIIHQWMKYWPYLFFPTNSKIYNINEVIIQPLSITKWTSCSQIKIQSITLFEARKVAGSATYKQS